ncbi:hypothetical protein SCLCIDRAFT_902997 [Scleroderma citrinum Foug A]|uniref:Uncharacterized protein n=1 Tax=Scleroderma citrinum Foug A TaxID=1036808 RepID=A0A0C3EL29_9AGAM|nr:hypothetical protein SCLCIDRAFT_902997 [Scleroderma citrinum Foug A]
MQMSYQMAYGGKRYRQSEKREEMPGSVDKIAWLICINHDIQGEENNSLDLNEVVNHGITPPCAISLHGYLAGWMTVVTAVLRKQCEDNTGIW